MTLPAELSVAERKLAEARSIGDLQELADFATSLRAWAKSRHLGIEAENEAAVFILRAERGIGAELRRMMEDGTRATHGARGGVPSRGWDGERPTLKMLGISRSQAQRFQSLAYIDDAEFERRLAERLAPSPDGKVERLAKSTFYWTPRPHVVGRGVAHDPLTPWLLLRTYASKVIESSMARLSSEDVSEIGKIGVRLVKAARAELDSRGKTA